MGYCFVSDEMLDDKREIIDFLSTTKIFMTDKSQDANGMSSIYKQFHKGDLICKWNVKYKDTVEYMDVKRWQATTISTIR